MDNLNIQNNNEDSVGVTTSANSEEIQKKYRPQTWVKGQSGNPAGKPKGSFSFKTIIKRRLEENPDKAEEIIQDYLENPDYRQLLWQMIDGRPHQTQDNKHELSSNLMQLLINAEDNKETS